MGPARRSGIDLEDRRRDRRRQSVRQWEALRAAQFRAALGGLAFDPETLSLYVADRETGFVHRFGMDGSERDRFDHGTTGRQAQGLPPVAFDPKAMLDITSREFDSTEPATWNYAAPERRLFGLAVYKHRLYYAVAAGLQIWSVGLKPDGSFGNDATLEAAGCRPD